MEDADEDAIALPNITAQVPAAIRIVCPLLVLAALALVPMDIMVLQEAVDAEDLAPAAPPRTPLPILLPLILEDTDEENAALALAPALVPLRAQAPAAAVILQNLSPAPAAQVQAALALDPRNQVLAQAQIPAAPALVLLQAPAAVPAALILAVLLPALALAPALNTMERKPRESTDESTETYRCTTAWEIPAALALAPAARILVLALDPVLLTRKIIRRDTRKIVKTTNTEEIRKIVIMGRNRIMSPTPVINNSIGGKDTTLVRPRMPVLRRRLDGLESVVSN
ncbi:MAG: hypothetical protein JSS80_12175 [Bacteroidetes bacterium]|nr:hypothetical protein [Bacteroidota bacterium]